MTRAVTALVAVLASYFAGYLVAKQEVDHTRLVANEAVLTAENCSMKLQNLNGVCQIWREFAEKGLRK